MLFRIVFFVMLFLGVMFHYQSHAYAGKDSTLYFRGSVSVTNNGFSFIPSFTLGKPAAIVNLAVGGRRFSFEPELRFAMEGKPWSFIFIWRYKLLQAARVQWTVGTHLPALAFRTVPTVVNGGTKELIVAQRFLPFETSLGYSIGAKTHLSAYYLYARGVEQDATLHTHFVALRALFSQIKITEKVHMRLNLQAFYLKTDERDGYYVAAHASLAHKNFPISIATMMNKAVRKSIPGDDFTWNISLIYSFDKKLIKTKL